MSWLGKIGKKNENLFSYSHLAYISRKSSKAQNEVATSVYILEVSGGLTISRIVGVYQNAGGIFIFIEKYPATQLSAPFKFASVSLTKGYNTK